MDKYKVVLIDNFNRDDVSDYILKDENKMPLENLSKERAEEIADAYNVGKPAYYDWFAVAKPQDYKLHDGTEVYR